jgi:tRNA wybutosine-synthesizing protein 4
MLSHFNKLKTPIHAVGKYPSLQQQRTRFLERGWQTSNTTARNLWDLWSDESFTPSALRRCLDAVEPFDEWEEFALFAGHYFLVDAQNSAFGSSAAMSMSSQVKPRDMDSAQSSSPLKVTHVATPDLAPTPRRFGSGFMLGSEIAAFHGGQGTQQRLTSIDVLRRSRETATGIQPPPTPQARMCHSITTFHLADNTPAALMVGGRKSPSQALAECWMLQHGDWHEVQQLSPARFRHSSAKITIPSPAASVQGVLIFGGKTSNNQVLDEVAVWTPNDGWQAIPVIGSRPAARFGAAICSLGPSHNRGLIIGGMQSDGTVLDDVWEFSISATPDLHVQFKDRTSDVRCHGQRNLHARFGASLVPFAQSLLLAGGVHKSEILGLSDDFLLITVGSEVIVEKVVNCLPEQWPLLVGCGITAVSEEEIVIAGGGAVCFSMGSYWNEPGYLSVTRIDAPVSQPWTVSVIDSVPTKDHAEVVAVKEPVPKSLPSKHKTKGKGNPNKPRNPKENPMPTPTPIPHTPLTSPADFTTLLTTSQPAIIPSLPLGPCTTLWTLPYLTSQIGADRPVTVHTSTSPHMTFASKNFTYTKQPFGTFISSVASGAQTYLRSISSTQPNKLPTKLEDDFPTIAGDFILPAVFEGIKDRIHSSPLRIAGPVSLWLHYDVLANLLFQIRGSKTLYLYPPSDVSHLDYPAGGSSSNTSPLTPSSPSTSSQLHKTHPHIAHLSPGDVLFIPPLWSHTATPQDGHSVAVNVFFRDMEDKVYAAGRDVYGNRDIQAYENGRRDVERIGRAFRDVPRSVARFYVERLAGELAGMKVGKEKEMEEGEREGERE